MPSGAKKRKAAKKKEVQAIQPPSPSHGEEDLKRGDKESDSEGSSPASQGYQNHQNEFTEGEVGNVEKELDDSHDRSIDENESNGVKHEGKKVEVVGNEDGGPVQVEGESESQKINVEFVEPVVESYRGGLRRSSSSSSNSSSNSSVDKYDVSDKNNIVVDDAPAVELVKDIESLPDKNSIVVDDAPAVELVKGNESLPDTQVADSLVGTTSTSDLDKAAISEDVVQVTTSASDADNVAASTVEPVVKEKAEENLCVVDGKDTASDTVVKIWAENLGAIVDKATISEVLKESGSEKRDEAATAASCDASAILNDNVKESPVLECHDHQLSALPSRPVQTTSWKNCCGLFELFAGSNR